MRTDRERGARPSDSRESPAPASPVGKAGAGAKALHFCVAFYDFSLLAVVVVVGVLALAPHRADQGRAVVGRVAIGLVGPDGRGVGDGAGAVRRHADRHEGSAL